MLHADHLVDQTIWRVWRDDVQSSASLMANRAWLCTQGGPNMFCSGTILLGPFDGLRTAVLDPKEITEGLDSLTSRWPSPSLGEGGQVHYKEEGYRQ